MRYLLMLSCLLLASCGADEPPRRQVDLPPEPSVKNATQPDELFSPKLKTTFSEDVDATQSEIAKYQRQAVEFSDRLQEAMGLSDEQIEKASRHDMSWDVGAYKISARHFCYIEAFDNWVTLLYAKPNGAGDPGWSNQVFAHPGPGWYYMPKGTATIIVPDKDIQDEIIQAVKEYLK